MNILEKVSKLEQETSEYGLAWENHQQIFSQIESELSEVKEELKNNNTSALQTEMGDLLHAVMTLCVFCRFDPKDTLDLALKKVERRFNAVKDIAHAQGLENLRGKTFAELMRFWDEAKLRVG